MLLIRTDGVQWREGGPGLDVVEHRVTVAERAAPAVLSAHADGRVLECQRAERQRLAATPIDLAVGRRHHGLALLEDLHHLGRRREAFGHAREGGRHLLEHGRGNARIRRPVVARPREAFPESSEHEHRLARHEIARVALRVAHELAELRDASIGLVGRDDALRFEALPIDRERRRMRGDLLVHDRLGERRIVELVVTVAAIADEVDEDVLLERLPERDREARRVHGGFRIVAVHVEDGRLDHLAEVGRLPGEPVVFGRRREADLVVHDHVDRTARSIAGELGEPERLLDHALPRERSIAVHEHGHDVRALLVVLAVLLRAHHAFDDGIDRLQVARIRGQREMHRLPGRRRVIARVAEMVLHVAVAGRFLRELRAFELGDQHLVGLPEHVREHVQPTAVRHPEDDLVDAVLIAGGIDQRPQEWNERVGTLEREPFRGRVLGVEKLLEPLGRDELLQDLHALLG